MNHRTDKLRYPLHILLALSLLLLGWFQLHHELTAHLNDDGQACQVCVFAGHLGDGVIASPPLTGKTAPAAIPFVVTRYSAPFLAQLFRTALSQRGPPPHTPA